MPRATDGPRRERVLVLLDATAARTHDPRLADYVDALVQALDGDLVVACQPRDADHFRRLGPRAVIVAGPAAVRWRGVRMLWRQFSLPRIARRHDVDAVHSPQPPVPLMIARPRVVTVHSLECFDRASATTVGAVLRRAIVWPRTAIRRAAVRTAVRTADEVIAPNVETANGLEEALAIDAHDVLVTAAAAEDLERFAAAHRLAYRSAALLVPAQTGPITLPVLDEQVGAGDSGASDPPR